MGGTSRIRERAARERQRVMGAEQPGADLGFLPAGPAGPQGPGVDYDEFNPDTWSGDERVEYLTNAGFEWVGGSGPSALWESPDGRVVNEATAFNLMLGYSVNEGYDSEGRPKIRNIPPNPPRPAAGRSSAPTTRTVNGVTYERGPDGEYRPARGLPASAPAGRAPTPPQTYIDDTTGDRVGIDPFTGQEVYRIEGVTWAKISPQEQEAIRQGDIQSARNWEMQTRAADWQRQDTRDTAQREFSAAENERGRAESRAENVAQRAARAAEFAATYAQNEAERRDRYNQYLASFGAQQKRDQLAAAAQYADQVSNVDPSALRGFLSVGGGNIFNAIGAGADALSENALRPAAQTLRTIETTAQPVGFTSTAQGQAAQPMLTQQDGRYFYGGRQITPEYNPFYSPGDDPSDLSGLGSLMAFQQQQAGAAQPAQAAKPAPEADAAIDARYMDRVRQFRKATDVTPPIEGGIYNVGFSSLAPTQQQAYGKSLQTRYGVGTQDIDAERRKYALKGFSQPARLGY